MRGSAVLVVLFAAACGDGETPADDGSTSGTPGSTTSSSTSSDASSTGSSSSSSGTPDDTSSSGTSSGSSSSSSGSSTGDAPFYEPCTENEMCDPLICNPLVGFCTMPCRTADECPDAPSGNPTPTCSLVSDTCVLSCIDGEMCPDGMTCEGNTELAFCQF